MLRTLIRTTAACLAITGCFDSGDGGGCESGNGLTGNGTFTYECLPNSGDGYCDVPSNEFPQTIARGGRFSLKYTGGAITPVSARAVRTIGTTYEALRAGSVGFVVLEDGEAVDALRLNVFEPDALAIKLPPAFIRGEKVSVRAAARYHGALAAGAMTAIAWSIEPPDLASVVSNENGACDVVPLKTGKGTILAALGTVRAEAPITVEADDDDVRDAGGDQ